jgi:hypothetical protein
VVGGLTYEDAVERLRERKRARRPHLKRVVLMGCAVVDLGKELELLGATPLERSHANGRAPTYARWLRSNHDPDRFTVLWLTGHYAVTWGDTLCDNQRGPTGLRSRFLRRRVQGWWRLPF